ncbi:SET domain-containing protein [Butyriboletus roseoflavus]|nr:SET domain-containing protein [Butyriboletus roseoflavus]
MSVSEKDIHRRGNLVPPVVDHMAGQPSTLFQRRWKNLLAWLESHGFQAQNLPVECREATHGRVIDSRSSNIIDTKRTQPAMGSLHAMPKCLLFVLPPESLMNKMTLKRLYPPNTRAVQALTAMQLISLHLFTWRPQADEDSRDPFFGPYISILPRNFDSHPLTWLVLSEKLNKADDLQISLLNSLPPSVLAELHRLHTRFWDDWCQVRTFLQKTPSIVAVAQVSSNSLEALDAVMDFLWAWLNVNTRCIYYRLKHAKTDPDNLTMCPILDFANHTPGQACMTPVPSNSEMWNAAPVNSIGDGLKFISPDNVKIEENDEILLTYGLRSNKTLFVEYGFVNLFKNETSPSGEVDVQDLVEKYVLIDVQLHDAVKAALVAEGYWGDWTLHSTPDSAQPSWRLITALRLYHFVVAIGSADEGTIQPWRDVVTGKRHRVSCENEQSWRTTVVLLCDMLIKRAEKSILLGSAQNKNKEATWARWMSENIQSLWREELFVARAVRESMLRGDEF